jgi:N-acetyl-gamma-glutamyl-phosphate reductase
MTHRVFIDGEVGTTGLQIRQRLAARTDLMVASLPEDRRKDPAARAEMINSVDAVILCLPDEASREAVSMIQNDQVRVIDASSAFRTAPGWTYGFPEMSAVQRQAVASSKRVSNPGCFPTGFIALVRPLIEAGLVPADWPVTVSAVSGYSGGGKPMIAEFEDETSDSYTSAAYRIYATGLEHKHVPEMQIHTGMTGRPLFAPSVGRYAQGMIVEVPLQLWAMPTLPQVSQLHEVLSLAYAGSRFVEVASLAKAASIKTLNPEALNGTNRLKLFVFGNEASGQARLVALLDNLGKGASGAAVQNLNLMLGLDEGEGLI